MLDFLYQPKHGIDSFRKLSTAGFVDGAGIDPNISNIVFEGLLAGVLDFGVSSKVLTCLGILIISICDLVRSLGVGQYGVRRYLALDVVFHLARLRIDEAHGCSKIDGKSRMVREAIVVRGRKGRDERDKMVKDRSQEAQEVPISTQLERESVEMELDDGWKLEVGVSRSCTLRVVTKHIYIHTKRFTLFQASE